MAPKSLVIHVEDIPMTYFWYPVLAIVAMVIAAVGVLIRLV